jgi:hypothetical protein
MYHVLRCPRLAECSCATSRWATETGQDFTNNTNVKGVDFGGIHVWPDNWEMCVVSRNAVRLAEPYVGAVRSPDMLVYGMPHISGPTTSCSSIGSDAHLPSHSCRLGSNAMTMQEAVKVSGEVGNGPYGRH